MIKESLKKVYYFLHNFKFKITDNAFSLVCKKRLKNKDFSIICSNCIGGIIYHRLGERFLSPTINMWIRQNEFLKLVSNLKYYMSLELDFIDSKYDYPVAKLDDVRIHFNHSKKIEEAKNDWEKRKKRINYDNLYIILYDRDDVELDKINDIIGRTNLKNIAVLTEHEEHATEEYIYYLKKTKRDRANKNYFIDKDKFNLRTFEKQFDFVKWLNTEI